MYKESASIHEYVYIDIYIYTALYSFIFMPLHPEFDFRSLLHVVGVLGAGLHELDAKGVRQLLPHENQWIMTGGPHFRKPP